MAKKKITLESLATQMQEGFARMTAGFAKHGKEIHDLTESVAFVVKHMATKEDLEDVRKELRKEMDGLATKEQVFSLHTQVNSIETQLRDMKHVKLHARVADLEEKVFGKARA